MPHADWARVKQIFAAAAELPADGRAAYVANACGDDDALRAEVASLLDASDSLPTEPPTTVTDDAGPAEAVGTSAERVGAYKLLELVGEGGMGEVWRAEQAHPIRRTVALKLIKPGMDSRAVVARFEQERQALALMNHPNVARVLDAGTTGTGRPYFVMEYVPGEPITAFCDRHRYTTKQRLELFAQACAAVQHAHQKAIIHRDLKPSNILVTLQEDKPLVKVIDFGIAKATAQRLTERTLFTETGQLVGTPEYMSPEQGEAGGRDIDTRSDVYSLGVVLYELLSGALPFEAKGLRGAGYGEIQRIIREVEPPRPSTRLSSLGESEGKEVATKRQTQVEELTKQLRRELEWIPLKAMRKDRAERYTTPAQLAEDVRNYLAGRPLIAGPETQAYRLRKFVRRNARATSAALGIVLFVAMGTSLYLFRVRVEQRKTEAALAEARKQRTEAEHQRVEAQRRREETDAVNRFLTNDLLAGARPANLPDKAARDLITQRLINPAAAVVALRFKDTPLIEAAVRHSLALTYLAVGRADLGRAHAEAALAIRRQALGDDHPDTLTSSNDLAHLLYEQGDFEQAVQLWRATLEQSRRTLGAQHPETLATLHNLGVQLHVLGRIDSAEVLLREALEGRRRVLGADHLDTLSSINALGVFLQSEGKFDQAQPLLEESLEGFRRVQGSDHPHTLTAISNLGLYFHGRRRFDEAEPLWREALERRRRVLGDDHPDTLRSINSLGNLLHEQRKLDEAEPLEREALERCRRALGDDHPVTLNAMSNLALLLRAKQRLDLAEPLFEELYKRAGNVQLSPARAASYMSRYGVCLAELGKYGQAIAPLTAAYERLAVTGAQNERRLREVLTALAESCEHLNRSAEAAKWRAELAAVRAATQPAAGRATQ